MRTLRGTLPDRRSGVNRIELAVIGRIRRVRIDCAGPAADTHQVPESTTRPTDPTPGNDAARLPRQKTAPAHGRGADSTEARSDRWLHRGVLLCAGGVLFVIAGSVFDPSESDADTIGQSPGTARLGPWTAEAAAHGQGPLVLGDADELWPRGLLRMPALLGVLESPDFRILIHAGDPEPLYTVCTPAGRVLAAELRADDVYREFPMIDPTRLRVDPPDDGGTRPLMLAWPLD